MKALGTATLRLRDVSHAGAALSLLVQQVIVSQSLPKHLLLSPSHLLWFWFLILPA